MVSTRKDWTREERLDTGHDSRLGDTACISTGPVFGFGRCPCVSLNSIPSRVSVPSPAYVLWSGPSTPTVDSFSVCYHCVPPFIWGSGPVERSRRGLYSEWVFQEPVSHVTTVDAEVCPLLGSYTEFCHSTVLRTRESGLNMFDL